MTKSTKKIEAALKSKGFSLLFAEWEPIGGNIEMMGRSGGWIVQFEHPDGGSDHIFGYNISEVIRQIQEWGEDTHGTSK